MISPSLPLGGTLLRGRRRWWWRSELKVGRVHLEMLVCDDVNGLVEILAAIGVLRVPGLSSACLRYEHER